MMINTITHVNLTLYLLKSYIIVFSFYCKIKNIILYLWINTNQNELYYKGYNCVIILLSTDKYL